MDRFPCSKERIQVLWMTVLGTNMLLTVLGTNIYKEVTGAVYCLEFDSVWFCEFGNRTAVYWTLFVSATFPF